MLLSACDQVALSLPQSIMRLDMQSLLLEFDDFFQSPISLPPHRSHNHRIPLQDENKLVDLP